MVALFADDSLTDAQRAEIADMEVTADEGWMDGDAVVCHDANGHLMALRPDGTWLSEADGEADPLLER